MTSLIPGDNVWLVWAAIIAMAAFAFISEQKWKWAQVLSSAIVGIFGAMLLANARVLPTTSPVYDTVFSYILPLAIPPLLFKCDIKKIIRESGSLFLIMNVSIVASCLAGLLCGYLFRATPGIKGIIAMMVGAYTGGTLNLVAMGQVFKVDEAYISAASVVVNIFVIFILLLYSFMTVSKWFRRTYRHPHIDEFEADTDKDTSISPAAKHWRPKPISLRDTALTLATALAITAVCQMLSKWIMGIEVAETAKVAKAFQDVGGSVYLLMPAMTLILVALFPKYFNSLAGAEEMGTLMIMLFFVALGCKADVRLFLAIGPIFLITAAIVLGGNLAVLLVAGKIFNWSLEDIITSSNATIGGPTTAAALAVNKGWRALVVPGLLVGLYGYAFGNYFGGFIASLVGFMAPAGG